MKNNVESYATIILCIRKSQLTESVADGRAPNGEHRGRKVSFAVETNIQRNGIDYRGNPTDPTIRG